MADAPKQNDLEQGRRLDKIRHEDRFQSAIEAFQDAIGTNYKQFNGLPRDFNFPIVMQFNERLESLTGKGQLTIHQAALQAVREISKEHHLGKGDSFVVKFDDNYHHTLDEKHIPQLPHTLHPAAPAKTR